MITKKNVMLFFRDQADEANVNGIDDQLCIPASRLVSMAPGSDTTIEMDFLSAKNNVLAHNDQLSYDTVTLTVTEGDLEEVMKAIVQKINSHPKSDGFLVIADDCTTTDPLVGDDATISAVYAHPSISGVASITVADYLFRAQMPDFGIGGVEPTNISAAQLNINTHYQSIAAATAMTIPSAGSTKAGDWITVFYDVKAGDGNAHTYTTTTDTTFSLGSTIRTAGGSHADRIPRADIAIAGDAVITITGATDGDGGQGTYLKFVNVSGTTNGWAAEVYVTAQGTGVTAGTAAFS